VSEQRPAHPAPTQEAASDQEAQHAPLPSTLAFVLAGVFVFVVVFVLPPLAQQMGEKRTTNAAATQYAARDQQPQDPAMIVVLTLVLALVGVLALVVVFRLVSLAQEMREKKAADALTAQQSASDQELEEAMFFIAAALLALFAFILVASLVATPFAQQTCEQRAPHASLTTSAACKE
jgi:flagellar biogenesis protein FliO